MELGAVGGGIHVLVLHSFASLRSTALVELGAVGGFSKMEAQYEEGFTYLCSIALLCWAIQL